MAKNQWHTSGDLSRNMAIWASYWFPLAFIAWILGNGEVVVFLNPLFQSKFY